MNIMQLFCLVEGDSLKNAFAVDINRNKLVAHLKDEIKQKNSNIFANIDAKDLQLWKVETPFNAAHINIKIANFPEDKKEELIAPMQIGDYWKDRPSNNHIHIIVHPPGN